jgi:hypothetical protein
MPRKDGEPKGKRVANPDFRVCPSRPSYQGDSIMKGEAGAHLGLQSP